VNEEQVTELLMHLREIVGMENARNVALAGNDLRSPVGESILAGASDISSAISEQSPLLSGDEIAQIIEALQIMAGIKGPRATNPAEGIASAIRSISHGGTTGPEGLEMLSMSMSGEGTGTPVGPAIETGLGEIAEAVREGMSEIASAISGLGGNSS
jgi:hypothetical protein